MEDRLLNNSDDNWDWSETKKSYWKECERDDGYLKFYQHCRSGGAEFRDAFPYELSLGTWPDDTALLPFHRDDTPGGRILVTESYDQLFNRIKAYRAAGGRGVVLTGQPGTGKSTFLKYTLARLLSEREVVLLCDDVYVYLFYRGMAYYQQTSLGFVGLPVHREHPARAPWTPIDVDYQTHGPPIRSGVWPIQASSPKPIQWKLWLKQFGGALWGMPLWSLEELIRGISLSPNYDTLRGILEEHLSQPDGLTAPYTGDPKVDAILEILHREMGRKNLVAAAATAVEEAAALEVCPGGLGDDTAVDQDQAPPPVPKVKMDRVLEILVRTATEEFGFIPRDVYRGILDLPEMRRRHAGAVDELNCSDLRKLVRMFTSEKDDLWKVDFKSIRVPELAAEAMRNETKRTIINGRYSMASADSQTARFWLGGSSRG